VISVDYAGGGWSVGADLQAQSGQYLVGDEANLQPRTKGFLVVDLHGSRMLARHVSIFAEVSNLFDRRYATFGTFSETGDVFLAEAPGATDPRSLGPGAPRRWKLGLKAKF
jgi:outer membrane receptor protein involved in Fe transport